MTITSTKRQTQYLQNTNDRGTQTQQKTGGEIVLRKG
jgi:hypothetical protein